MQRLMSTAPTPLSPDGAARRWKNPWARLPLWRWLSQAAFLVLVTSAGVEFALFVDSLRRGEMPSVTRPPSVEGFLPISALMGLKRLLLTGEYDEVHPAGLTIFIVALVTAVLARKAFCGWVCPVGTLSRALEWLGTRLLRRRRRRDVLVPPWLDALLMLPKYVVLGFFAYVVLVRMDLAALLAFMHSPYNYAVDAKMLDFFVAMSTTTAVVLLALAALSLVIKNFWCRYLCPYGALLGVSAASPLAVVRREQTCIDCKLCTRVCPSEIKVHAKYRVLSPECTGCLNCLAVCPVADTLTLTGRGPRGLSPYLVPAIMIGSFVLAWALAVVTGHWQTTVPLAVLGEMYQHSATLPHP